MWHVSLKISDLLNSDENIRDIYSWAAPHIRLVSGDQADTGRCGILFLKSNKWRRSKVAQFTLKETRTLRPDPGECVSVRIMWGNTSPRFVPNRFRAFYAENKWSCWLTGAGAIRPYSLFFPLPGPGSSWVASPGPGPV